MIVPVSNWVWLLQNKAERATIGFIVEPGEYKPERVLLINGFKGLFPGNMALVETSMLAGMLIKYEEDFMLCSKIEEAMGFNLNNDIARSILTTQHWIIR